MMRAGISRVVVEIIILVIAVALALLIFSPISGYIFGSLGRTSTVGGAANIQVLSVYRDSSNHVTLDVKNLGPGTITGSGSGGVVTSGDFKVFIDGNDAGVFGISPQNTIWSVNAVITITTNTTYAQTDPFWTKSHNILVYGPGNTQAQYLYSP